MSPMFVIEYHKQELLFSSIYPGCDLKILGTSHLQPMADLRCTGTSNSCFTSTALNILLNLLCQRLLLFWAWSTCWEASAIMHFSCSVFLVLALIVDPCGLPPLLLGMSAVELAVIVTVFCKELLPVSADNGEVRFSWQIIVGNNFLDNWCASVSIFFTALFSWLWVSWKLA